MAEWLGVIVEYMWCIWGWMLSLVFDWRKKLSTLNLTLQTR